MSQEYQLFQYPGTVQGAEGAEKIEVRTLSIDAISRRIPLNKQVTIQQEREVCEPVSSAGVQCT